MKLLLKSLRFVPRESHAFRFLIFPVFKEKSFSSASSMSFPGKKVYVNGIEIHYEQVGDGNHKVLLLPGALGSTRTDFTPQLEKMDGTKFTIVAWDPPGYGYSRPPEREFPRDFFYKDAEMAASLMDKLNFKKYSILGWSDGGITGLIMAAKYSQAVQKLVVWGASSYLTAQDAKNMQATRDIKDWSERMRAPMVAIYGVEHFAHLWKTYVDTFVGFFEKDGGDLCTEDLKNIKCPTLIFHGAKDPMVDSCHPTYLLDNIKNAKLKVMEEGKHNIHLRYADNFNSEVEEFLLH